MNVRRSRVFLNTRVAFQHDSRGVAQPGRAPGSGPGGRRFKSSLPDHSFPSSVTYTAFAALDFDRVFDIIGTTEGSSKPIPHFSAHSFRKTTSSLILS